MKWLICERKQRRQKGSVSRQYKIVNLIFFFAVVTDMGENNLTLESFQISRKTGFVPETPPPTALPDCFKEWNEVARNLSDLLQKKQLRDAVHRLPDFKSENLGSIDEWRTALVLLSGIFQGYMWQDGEMGLPEKMPAILCVPFNNVSRKIGTPLVVTYASVVLYNCHLRDPKKGMTMENLQAIVNHTGTDDESWFFMIHIVIELEAVPAIEAIWNGLSAVQQENKDMVVDCLAKIGSALSMMEQFLTRTAEKCDPKVFYVKIRPFVTGTKGIDALPNGMIYEEVYGEEMPQRFSGASAAESTPLKALDIFLGIEHNAKNKEFLESMKQYMPVKHREFLDYLSINPSVRQYVVDSNDKDIIQQFNSTIDAFVSFRSQHITIVTRFIVNQMPHTVNESLKDRGTGGTSFMDFLKSVRDDTIEAKIKL